MLLVLPIVGLVLAPAAPGVVYLVGGLDLALLALAVLDAALALRRPVEIERRLPHRLSVGVRNRVALVVYNRGRRPLRLRLRDELPARFESDAGRLRVDVPAFARATVAYRVTPPARGRYAWGEVWLRVAGPLGLGLAERRARLAFEAKVYPDIRGASRLVLAGGARDLTVMGVHNLRHEGEGSEFEMLREYARGDAFRDIDWKATARRDGPVVRVRQPERSQSVLLCIDAGRLMAVRAGALSKLDHAVNAALLLAFVALRNEDRVGLLLFADEVLSYLPPAKGRGQYRRILEALYAVEPSLTYVDYRAFARAVLARQTRRALVLTFTDLHDEATSRPLVHQVRRIAARHLPVVLALRDPSLEGVARAAPTTEEDPWRMAVAAELLEEREGLRRGLAAAGAHVLDPLPEEAMVVAVNAYVRAKRREAI